MAADKAPDALDARADDNKHADKLEQHNGHVHQGTQQAMQKLQADAPSFSLWAPGEQERFRSGLVSREPMVKPLGY